MKNTRSQDQTPVRLSPEQMELIREAEKRFERGEFYTMEEALKHIDKRHREWLRAARIPVTH